MGRIRTLIMGAAGRDFHNFNTIFRDDETREVVAFTATQIPYIEDRTYPAEIAGKLYPQGIPIYDESELEGLIQKEKIEEVYFSYSDVPYNYVLSRGAAVQAAGAKFVLWNPHQTMIPATKPVISVCAVRTGCGKSQTTRFVAEVLKKRGLKIAAVRHPMPYGNLVAQRCQRFETLEDLKKHNCTIEEMEEYEPHLMRGSLVFAGVDYAEILAAAQSEVDVVLWDGGNNDLPFFKPDLHIVVTDPHRVGHERRYFPGEVNARLADVLVINKEDSAEAKDIEALEESLAGLNAAAKVVHADSLITVDDPDAVKGKRVICVEDGPTLTHGEMKYGAAVIAAKRLGAEVIVDPRPWIEGTVKDTFDRYPEIGALLPANGYSDAEIRDLGAVIDKADAELVLVGTPIDLTRVVTFNKPSQRVRYDLAEKGGTPFTDLLNLFVDENTK